MFCLLSSFSPSCIYFHTPLCTCCKHFSTRQSCLVEYTSLSRIGKSFYGFWVNNIDIDRNDLHNQLYKEEKTSRNFHISSNLPFLWPNHWVWWMPPRNIWHLIFHFRYPNMLDQSNQIKMQFKFQIRNHRYFPSSYW